MDSCNFKIPNRSNYAYGFSKKCELNIYKMQKFLEKKKNEMGIQGMPLVFTSRP